jgi:multimeric flavodoxin WrbA/putative sterol carrier protein
MDLREETNMKLANRIIALTLTMIFNIIAHVANYDVTQLNFIVLGILGLLITNLIYNQIKHKKDFITIGISSISIIGITAIYVFPALGEIYIKNVIAFFYLSLFLIALSPQLFKQQPFTVEISKGGYPESVTKTEQFLNINIIIAYIWAFIFLLAIVLTIIPYSSNKLINTILSNALPIIPQVTIGIYAATKLPKYLMGRVKAKPFKFESIKDMFLAMPYGLNKQTAKGVDTIVQFDLSGNEKVEGYFIIKDLLCTFTEGVHKNPKTIITSDSKLWLDISNGDVSGDEEFLKGNYEVGGDMSILLDFGGLFAPPSSTTKEKKLKKKKPQAFVYKKFAPNKIKNIVVFDGGPRNKKYSKTTFMTDNFTKGAIEAGASVEYIKLNKMEIKNCSGCYNCWTKTPGECIYKDDMTELRKKYREADLVVFSSPLYIFNVTGIMKTFMDRLLPIMKPYMLSDEQGNTLHPDRFPELGEQGFVVFSSGGFPEVDHNFDGLQAMYKNWNSHSENAHLMGEFYLTAAEIITQPVYKKRRELIADACQKAGQQIVKEGYISQEYMTVPVTLNTTKEIFKSQADMFWSTMDGKESYLKGAPKFK